MSCGLQQFPAVEFVFTTSHNANPSLAWDVRVDVKSGANPVVLDQKNAGPLQYVLSNGRSELTISDRSVGPWTPTPVVTVFRESSSLIPPC
jgi:hypothetical protein